MEFIPLEPKKKGKRGKKIRERNTWTESDTLRNIEGKVQKKEGRHVKNRYKEKILEKRAQKSLSKKLKKQVDGKVDTEIIQMHVKNERNINNVMGDDDNHAVTSSDNDFEGISKEIEEDKKEQRTREKLKEMDERKKNRLFVKMKKKIINESQIKELHPDIKQVIFPRKKNSKWCWAVFASEERAHEGFLKLVKAGNVFVSKPNLSSQVELKREKKMQAVKRKEQAKKKLLDMWT